MLYFYILCFSRDFVMLSMLNVDAKIAVCRRTCCLDDEYSACCSVWCCGFCIHAVTAASSDAVRGATPMDRVPTNLENLELSGNFVNLEKSGNLRYGQGIFLWHVTWFVTCLSMSWSLHVKCKLNYLKLSPFMMTLISWVNRIYGSQGLAALPTKCQPNL